MVTILDVLHDKKLFAQLFKDQRTWHAWEVYLSALFGLPIRGEKDLELFRQATGLEEPPTVPARESYVICGRRSGKSYTSSILATHLSVFKDWSPYLAPGERGWVFIIATDKAQAGIIKGYISGIFDRVKMLRPYVQRETQEQIDLKNGISIAVKPASFRGVRGYTLVAAILEELSFYRSDESANPDKEIVAAIRPALATCPESMLIGISTPYAKAGHLYDMYKRYHGKADGPLIWVAPSRRMNSTLDPKMIERAVAEDPQAARAEWEATFRDDISAFINLEAVEAAVIPGRLELPPLADERYEAFIDPSGGSSDSFTMAIGHRGALGKVVIDAIRERRPPFTPSAVVAEYAELMKNYHIYRAKSDHYAGAWVPEAFKAHGITIDSSDMSASDYYLNVLPIILNGTAELLDNKRLVAQFASLERRVRPAGKDLITHPQGGGHDDICNSVSGVLVGLAKPAIRREIIWL
ncbi:MAG: terminase family protein [Acidobacteriota bacterium]